MKVIFPITVEEFSAGDAYLLYDLKDLKIFVWENSNILDEFRARTAEGNYIRLTAEIMTADNIDDFIEENHNQ